MSRFAANLTFLFIEMPILDRFAAAKKAGFEGVEMLFPYDIPAQDLAKAAKKQGLEFVLLNAPAANWAGGPRGFAADPDGRPRFRHDFDRALRYAQMLGCRHIHLMSGSFKGDEAHHTMVQNLRWACNRAPHASLTIEPLNPQDMPGYFLDNFDLAAEIIAEVDQPNLGLQFDAYHAHRLTGDVIGTWDQHCHLARHIQIGGYPGRHEPDHGVIDFPRFFRAAEAAGYRGWISAEYVPFRTTAAGLGWLKQELSANA
ncbi:MAG: TIM barrel protein [Paracoccus sp. (in: a-proteobacteria)]|uniref:hydroxypyruvate isomerase family protein n=1 Tax=Paracoccus sp. TaxID=267 RepID=UPI0026DF9A44|nr:TIM barrel protein [Paracoccus sp. (in: a-proteobacteria)]MDO5620421.1 TIM barrel protein [Paracoccus sp. (in: a-proteobacteria)]